MGRVRPDWGRFMYVPVPCKRHLSLATLPVVLALSMFVLWVGVVYAQSPESGSTAPKTPVYDEAEAQRIDRMLMCPVCPAETIDQAQVEISRQMRRLVREKLSQGASRQEILDFFADRYGKDILAAPPKSGVNLVAWLVPVVAVLGAIVAGFAVIRSMTRSGARAAVTETAMDDDLAPYLDIIDRDLGFDGSGFPAQTENRAPPNIVAGSESESGARDSEPPLQDVN